MCSIVFNFFLNKIYNTYRDLQTRIILNNVLKVTLDIVEIFFLPNEQLRAHQLWIYILSWYCRLRNLPCATGKSSFKNLIKASWNYILVDARAIESWWRQPLPNAVKEVFTSKNNQARYESRKKTEESKNYIKKDGMMQTRYAEQKGTNRLLKIIQKLRES